MTLAGHDFRHGSLFVARYTLTLVGKVMVWINTGITILVVTISNVAMNYIMAKVLTMTMGNLTSSGDSSGHCRRQCIMALFVARFVLQFVLPLL